MAAILALVFLLIVFVIALCFKIAGGVLKLALKLIFCIPAAILFAVFGIVLCCTLILIPLGIACFKIAWNILNPFSMCMC